MIREVTKLEKDLGSISTEERLILDVLLCVIGPDHAAHSVEKCKKLDEDFAEENKVLLEYVAPHLIS